MRQFLSLVGLFLQQFIRRKSLWVLLAIAAGAVLLNFRIASEMNQMLGQGVRYDIVTHKAAGLLDSWLAEVRGILLTAALIVGAMVAPASRRDGTTQFLLMLSVGRLRLALAQFAALAACITIATLLVHAGYQYAAVRVGIFQPAEAWLAWLPLLVILLALAATSFALSLTRSFVVVYGLLRGIPDLLLPLLQAMVALASRQEYLPDGVLTPMAHALENAAQLFPRLDELVAWPHLFVPVAERPPFPALGVEAIHSLAAVALWIVLGLWAYRRYDFGSRLPTK